MKDPSHHLWGNWSLTLADNSLQDIWLREADSSLVSQNIPSLCGKLEWHYRIQYHPLYPQAQVSSQLFSSCFHDRHCVPFIFHVRVDLTTCLFLLLPPPESSLYFFSYNCVPRDFLPPFFLTGSEEWYWWEIPNVKFTGLHNLQYYFSPPTPLYPPYDKMIFSAPRFPTASTYILPLTYKIDLHFHIKPREN